MTAIALLERVDVIVEELHNNKLRLGDFVHNTYVNYECLRELEIRREKILKINHNKIQYSTGGELAEKILN